MDPEYRKHLLVRRQQLKERLAQEEQKKHCSELLERLDLDLIAYEIIWALPSTTNPTDWLSNSFPITWWGRVDWQKVPRHIKIYWSNHQDLTNKFFNLALELKLGNPRVIISWFNANSLSLKLPLEAVKQNAELIFSLDWDCWIMCLETGWCIEKYHEGELYFGYIPNLIIPA